MLLLEAAQANFIATINEGPDALDTALFDGPIDRVLLGLKAHANTINHARLVALEETFPLTRQALGDEPFNQLSRSYVETPEARACDANTIGQPFPDFLQATINDQAIVELANIERAWLESYHATETVPLSLTDLTKLGEAALLALPVALHPSARLVLTSHPLAAPLGELAGLQSYAILTLRPEAEVRLLPFGEIETAIFYAAQQKDATLGNLLSSAIEQASDTDPSGPVMQLIGAGALVMRE
jgi:hypothetical protein